MSEQTRPPASLVTEAATLERCREDYQRGGADRAAIDKFVQRTAPSASGTPARPSAASQA